MLFQKYFKFSTKKIRNENLKYDGMFENLLFVEMESSKCIIYLTNMCCNGQGTKFGCFLITTRLGWFYVKRIFRDHIIKSISSFFQENKPQFQNQNKNLNYQLISYFSLVITTCYA